MTLVTFKYGALHLQLGFGTGQRNLTALSGLQPADLGQQPAALVRRPTRVSAGRPNAHRARLEGYSLGFTDFAVAGYRQLSPLCGGTSGLRYAAESDTESKSEWLTHAGARYSYGELAVDGAQAAAVFSTPVFTADRKGAGTISPTVPSGAREAMVVIRARGGTGSGLCVVSHEADAFYTVVAHNSGPQHVRLADDLGPLTESGQKDVNDLPSARLSDICGRYGLPGLRSLVSGELIAVAADHGA